MIDSGMLIVVSGPSGVGKDTVVETFLKDRTDCSLSVSATTRKPRQGEIEGIDYHFIDEAKFEEYIKNGALLEYAKYSGNYYGTLKQAVTSQREIGKHVILIIETKGAQKVKELCPNAVFVFLMPPSLECLEKRLARRQTESAEMIAQRLKIACDEIEEGKNYDFILINENLNETINKLSCIVTATKCSPSHVPNLLKWSC